MKVSMNNTGNWFSRYCFCSITCMALLPIALIANNFIPVKLLHGVQIEIPLNWKVQSKNQLITLDSAAQALYAHTGIYDASSDLNFGANCYDDAGKTVALINVNFYSNLAFSQTDARIAQQSDINELDIALYEKIVQASQINNFSILSWNGTSRQVINGITAFITEYKRSPIKNNGNFKVRHIIVFNDRKSFTLTISYREDQEYLFRPICNHIISHIILDGLVKNSKPQNRSS